MRRRWFVLLAIVGPLAALAIVMWWPRADELEFLRKYGAKETTSTGIEGNSLLRLKVVTRVFKFPGPLPDAAKKEFREFSKEKEKLRNGLENQHLLWIDPEGNRLGYTHAYAINPVEVWWSKAKRTLGLGL